MIVPAATDVHVHFRDPPGAPDVESIGTGTVRAALGGVGLVGEMPNTLPPVDTVERFDDKAARVLGRAAVDVLLYATPTRPREMAGLAARAGAFKLYLSPTTGIETPVAPDELGPLLGRLSALGLPLTVHAEDPAAFRSDRPADDPSGWNRTRPPDAERRAVTALLAAAPAELRLLVAHVSLPDVAERLYGHGVTFETSPHHLLLSERSGSDGRFKTNPPLRAESDRAGLWSAFTRGRVPIVASDHAPHAAEAKHGRFAEAPSGAPGVQTLLPLLFARVRAGDLSLPTVLAAACDRPARWFGQPMGRLAVGHRANLLIVDFTRRTTVAEGDRHGSAVGSPFEGREAIFPVEHWRDGERIVAEGEYVGRPQGRLVRPEFAPGPRALATSS